jgi:hypothetical protein
LQHLREILIEQHLVAGWDRKLGTDLTARVGKEAGLHRVDAWREVAAGSEADIDPGECPEIVDLVARDRLTSGISYPPLRSYPIPHPDSRTHVLNRRGLDAFQETIRTLDE